jgi:hypothetical protein
MDHVRCLSCRARGRTGPHIGSCARGGGPLPEFCARSAVPRCGAKPRPVFRGFGPAPRPPTTTLKPREPGLDLHV